MKIYLYFSILVLMFVTGCFSSRENKALAEYKSKHPQDFDRFVYIYPINLNSYRGMLGDRAAWVDGICGDLKREFTDTKGIKEFADKQEIAEAKDRQDELNKYKEFEQLSSGDGAICQFEWDDKKTQELGLLVLKNGEIVKRDVWVSELLHQSVQAVHSATITNK